LTYPFTVGICLFATPSSYSPSSTSSSTSADPGLPFMWTTNSTNSTPTEETTTTTTNTPTSRMRNDIRPPPAQRCIRTSSWPGLTTTTRMAPPPIFPDVDESLAQLRLAPREESWAVQQSVTTAATSDNFTIGTTSPPPPRTPLRGFSNVMHQYRFGCHSADDVCGSCSRILLSTADTDNLPVLDIKEEEEGDDDDHNSPPGRPKLQMRSHSAKFFRKCEK